MLVFILRRLLTLPLVMLGLTLLIVGLMQVLTPSQRAAAFVKNEKQLRNLPQIVREQGLDQPFLVQYGRWLGNAVRGQLGYSKASANTGERNHPRTLPSHPRAEPLRDDSGAWAGHLDGHAGGLQARRLV